jgi:hypothetical protein
MTNVVKLNLTPNRDAGREALDESDDGIIVSRKDGCWTFNCWGGVRRMEMLGMLQTMIHEILRD